MCKTKPIAFKNNIYFREIMGFKTVISNKLASYNFPKRGCLYFYNTLSPNGKGII